MLLVQQIAHVAARWWTTQKGDRPGCQRHHNKFKARVHWRGAWVYLGLFGDEQTAARVHELAEAMKKAGGLARCRNRADVRRVVRQRAKSAGVAKQ